MFCFESLLTKVQQTAVFHVDDVKASCVNKQENEILIEFLKKKHEIEGLPGLKVNRGKEHIIDFLSHFLITESYCF